MDLIHRIRGFVLPGLTLDLPFDKSAYLDQIAARFANEAIADQLERICMDGWSKMPIDIRPTLASCLAQGIAPRHGYVCAASWYVKSTDAFGFSRRVFESSKPGPPSPARVVMTAAPGSSTSVLSSCATTRMAWLPVSATSTWYSVIVTVAGGEGGGST